MSNVLCAKIFFEGLVFPSSLSLTSVISSHAGFDPPSLTHATKLGERRGVLADHEEDELVLDLYHAGAKGASQLAGCFLSCRVRPAGSQRLRKP